MSSLVIHQRRKLWICLQPRDESDEDRMVTARGARLGLNLNVRRPSLEENDAMGSEKTRHVVEPISVWCFARKAGGQRNLRVRQHIDAKPRRLCERPVSIAI